MAVAVQGVHGCAEGTRQRTPWKSLTGRNKGEDGLAHLLLKRLLSTQQLKPLISVYFMSLPSVIFVQMSLLQFFVMSTKRTVMGGDLWRVDGQEWVN
jgi:hypothetical protein